MSSLNIHYSRNTYMKYVQIIFSPTGWKKQGSKVLTKDWPSVDIVDLSVAGDDYSKPVFQFEDIVLIAMPSFGDFLL